MKIEDLKSIISSKDQQVHIIEWLVRIKSPLERVHVA